MRLVEYAPGQFARQGEIVTASDGRRWFLDFPAGTLARAGAFRWRRANVPLDVLADDRTPLPPELVSRVGDPSLFGRFRSGR